MKYLITLLGVSLCAVNGVGANGVVHPFTDYGFSQAETKEHFFHTSDAVQTRGPCSSGQFAESQILFNSALGIPNTTDWHMAQTLTNGVNSIIFRDTKGLATVCAARQQFAQNLATSYPNCVNRFYLLEQGSTFANAVTYVHLYKHLEFICSTGFEVYQYNLPCIKVYQTNPSYNACFTALFNTTNADPNSFCSASATFIACIQAFTRSQCGQAVGWVECEKERIGFAYDCQGLVCPAY